MKSVRGEKARNGRDFLDASIVVGVVVPLAEGELPSAGKSPVDVALGVVELGSRGESGRDDSCSKLDSRDAGELKVGRESLLEGLGKKITIYFVTYCRWTPSPSVRVSRRFFRFGNVCRISSARKSRSAIS